MALMEEPGPRRLREAGVLLVCGRCQPTENLPWVWVLRRRLARAIGGKAVTVAVAGCVGMCPPGATAAVLASPGRGCWEWALDRRDIANPSGFAAQLCHPSAGLACAAPAGHPDGVTADLAGVGEV